MKRVGFFVGFLIEAETQGDAQAEEILRRLEERDRRDKRRDVIFFVVGISVTVLVGFAGIAFYLVGH
jgi:hypothetical protein